MQIRTQQQESKPKARNEAQEIELAKQDLNNFQVLYDRYYVQIFRFIYQRMDDENDAADLSQQVFLKAMNALPKYEHRNYPFSAWLYRIARNEVNMFYRKKGRHRVYHAMDEQLNQIADDIQDDAREEQISKLKVALSRLKASDMEIIEMKFFEQRSHREIAQIIGISEENSKVRVHRVIGKLKKLLH